MKKSAKTRAIKISYHILLIAAASIVLSLLCIMLIAGDAAAIMQSELVVPITAAVFLMFVAMYIYIYNTCKAGDSAEGVSKTGAINYSSICLTLLVSCALARFVSPYALPVAAVALLNGILLGRRSGLMTNMVTASLLLIIMPATSYYFENIMNLAYVFAPIVGLATGYFMLLLLRKYTRFKLTWGAILIGLLVAPFACVLELAHEFSVSASLYAGLYSAVGNLIAIGIFTAILPLYEGATRIWTDFKLAELCSFKQPLLKQLRENAPGTFNHSLTVANLAESCAMAIELNPFMARACAYYHDVGKLNNPQFFTENQRDGYNPHDELIPEVSANMIKRHTRLGYETLKAARMPEEICLAALEHHGDAAIMYFYLKAKGITEGGNLDDEVFRYDGPKPNTKYSALIMICDVCEAITRAKVPQSEEELKNIVGNAVDERLRDGQFDECDLTIREITEIKNAICETLPGIMHKRIDYKKAEEKR